MIAWFRDLLYGSVPVEFSSAYGMADSVARLRAVTVRSIFLSLHKQSAVGRVEQNSVLLQRVIPLVRNSFKPFFIGHFEHRGRSVVLVGRFTMHWFVKAFTNFWLGAVALWTLFAFTTVTKQPHHDRWPILLVGLGMIGFVLALLPFGKWLARNDTEWLSAVIRTALSVEIRDQQLRPATAKRDLR